MELISRRKVLEYVADYYLNNRGRPMEWTVSVGDIFDEVKAMPIIESRPKGKWETLSREKGACEIFFANKKCSHCGYEYCFPFNYKYCPECGADMRSEE